MNKRTLKYVLWIVSGFLISVGPALGTGDIPLAEDSQQELVHTTQHESVTVEVGEQKSIHITDASQLSIGKKGVVNVRVLDQNEVLLTGLNVGATELLFWNLNNERVSLKVEVVPPLNHLVRDIRRVLADVQNLKVEIVGANVVLDGKLLTMRDAKRVEIIAKQLGGDMVINLCSVDRGPENVLVEKFITNLFGQDTVNVRILGGTAYLTGYVYNQQQKDRLLTLTKGQVEKIVDLTDIREVMIDTEIVFVKMSRSTGENFGINLLDGSDVLDPTLGIAGERTREGSEWGSMDVDVAFSTVISPKIKALVSNGDASILACPHIITKSGEKGSFLSGGTQYYEVASAMAADLKSVDYGVIIEVQPHFLNENEIVSSVEMEMSFPVISSGSAELSLDKYEMKNTMSCQLGQSLILSGFLEDIQNSNKEGTPVLGKIPLLNLFFRNKTSSDDETEVIAIITPRVVNAKHQDKITSLLSVEMQESIFDAMTPMNDSEDRDIQDDSSSADIDEKSSSAPSVTDVNVQQSS